MQTQERSNNPILSQTENNTTLWIGHLQADPHDHIAGQTFKCPSDGVVNNIQVFSSTVQNPGEVALTLHEFDAETKTWGLPIADATIYMQKGDDARWIRFGLAPVHLIKDANYGFRLHTDNAFIGIGEAVSHSQKPFPFGKVWTGETMNEKGQFFSYFSMAFKVELCA